MRGGCVAYGRPSVVVVVNVVVGYLRRSPRRRRLSHVIADAPRIAAVRLAMRMMKPSSEVTNDVSDNF